MKKIIIQLNDRFTKESWLKKFKEKLGDSYINNYEIQFVFTTKELFQNLSHANVCFSFNFPKLDLVSHLDLLYLGISDINYLDKYNIPKSFNLHTSKGIACNIIAEHTLLMALLLIRKYPLAILNQRNRIWNQSVFFEEDVRSVRDYNIGVLGLGNNGRSIAKMFKNIGCKVLGYSNNESKDVYIDKWYSTDNINQFLNDSQIIIIALPLRKDTYQFIDNSKFHIMGKETIIINIARGEIINEQDLKTALKNDKIKAAALDVFEKEPLSKWSKLWKLPNLIITPHIAGNIHFLINEIQNDFINKLK